jgi:hypothetical protein
MKTCSFQTIGVEVPKPGIFIFHFTFSVSLHAVGGFAPAAVPFASGPRHRGQSPADVEDCSAAERARPAAKTAENEREQTRDIAAGLNAGSGNLFR